jgi:nucleotide-binding universal stress UspA family protein
VVVTAFDPAPVSAPVGSEEAPAEMGWATTPAASADEIAQKAASVARRVGAADVSTRVSAGEPAAVLLELAAEDDASVIVVGSKGLNGRARFLLGSVPGSVAHHASCDVLVVRTS